MCACPLSTVSKRPGGSWPPDCRRASSCSRRTTSTSTSTPPCRRRQRVPTQGRPSVGAGRGSPRCRPWRRPARRHVTRRLSIGSPRPSPARGRWPRARVAALAQLTERGMEVLRHVAAAGSNGEIAELLGVSEATVKTHVSAVLRSSESTTGFRQSCSPTRRASSSLRSRGERFKARRPCRSRRASSAANTVRWVARLASPGPVRQVRLVGRTVATKAAISAVAAAVAGAVGGDVVGRWSPAVEVVDLDDRAVRSVCPRLPKTGVPRSSCRVTADDGERRGDAAGELESTTWWSTTSLSQP